MHNYSWNFLFYSCKLRNLSLKAGIFHFATLIISPPHTLMPDYPNPYSSGWFNTDNRTRIASASQMHLTVPLESSGNYPWRMAGKIRSRIQSCLLQIKQFLRALAMSKRHEEVDPMPEALAKGYVCQLDAHKIRHQKVFYLGTFLI